MFTYMYLYVLHCKFCVFPVNSLILQYAKYMTKLLRTMRQSKAALKPCRQHAGIHVTVSHSTASMSDFSPLAQHDLSKMLLK